MDVDIEIMTAKTIALVRALTVRLSQEIEKKEYAFSKKDMVKLTKKFLKLERDLDFLATDLPMLVLYEKKAAAVCNDYFIEE